MKMLRFSLMALIASLLLVPVSYAAEPDGWELLKSLAGEWEGKAEKSPDVARVSYKVVSKGSAVVETMKTPDAGPEMITVYHRDGDALMMTHYCAVGNQPRMRATSSAAGGKLEFRFVDATNLTSPDAAHMRDLTMTVQDKDHLTQEWVFREKGKDVKAVFRLTRIKN